ncbi:MAG: tetratricopeptide repeat protein [Psychrobium sp.]
MTKAVIPKDWCEEAHQHWLNEDKGQCIKLAIEALNQHGVVKPKGLYEQISYYLYLSDDFKSAAFFIEQGLKHYPDDKQMGSNLVSIYSQLKRHQEAIDVAEKLLRRDVEDSNLLDALCSSLYQSKHYQRATEIGTKSLTLKDKRYRQSPPQLKLNLDICYSSVAQKTKVIAYSLWGNNPRYINGTLRNLILAKDIYPEWQVWLYLDGSVDEAHIEAFKQLGAIIHRQPDNQSIKQKLCWRFLVASDRRVGYFMVRDADSVISPREFQAVEHWLISQKPFHILRDWWSHTDLILAGMWGGISGVLPPMAPMIESFQSGKMMTPHIDQWFLGQVLWPTIKDHSLIHDRCFKHSLSTPMPGINPGDIRHIGSCEYSQDSAKQEAYLAPWKQMLYAETSPNK